MDNECEVKVDDAVFDKGAIWVSPLPVGTVKKQGEVVKGEGFPFSTGDNLNWQA